MYEKITKKNIANCVYATDVDIYSPVYFLLIKCKSIIFYTLFE